MRYQPLPRKAEAMAYLKANRNKLTLVQIAADMDMPLPTIKRYVNELGLDKRQYTRPISYTTEKFEVVTKGNTRTFTLRG